MRCTTIMLAHNNNESWLKYRFVLFFSPGLQRATRTLLTCVWRGSRTWRENTVREGTTLKLPTVWSTVRRWWQNTSTCWRIVATCQSVVSRFRSVEGKGWESSPQLLTSANLFSEWSGFFFRSEHFIQRIGGVGRVRWHLVSRGGGDLCWEVLQRIGFSWPPGASSCLF